MVQVVERLRAMLYQPRPLTRIERAEAMRLIDLIYTYAQPLTPRVTRLKLVSGERVEVHHQGWQVTVDDREVGLTPAEFALFDHLIEFGHDVRYVARYEVLGDILETVNRRVEDNRSTAAHLLKTHLSFLRAKLGVGVPGLILTIHRRGWQLNHGIIRHEEGR